MEPGSGVIHSMIDGACRQDYNQIPPYLPFGIKLRTMVCYKAWKRTVIEIDQKLPVEILEPEDEEDSEEGEPSDDAAADDEEGSTADLGLDPCWNIHPVICKDNPKHPLIKERGRFYLERKEELALKNMVRQLKEQAPN